MILKTANVQPLTRHVFMRIISIAIYSKYFLFLPLNARPMIVLKITKFTYMAV